MNSSTPVTQEPERPVKTHLENALEEADPAEKNFYIRSALQHLERHETG